MKIVTFLLFAFVLSTTAFSQKIDSVSISKLSPEKQEEANMLMQKYRTMRNTSTIMGIGGGIILLTGIAIVLAGIDNNSSSDSGAEVGAVMVLGGSVILLSSIPFTVLKHVRYGQAKAIVFANRGVSMVPGNLMPNTRSFGVTLAIPLGR